MISRWLVILFCVASLFSSAAAERVLSEEASAALWTVGPGKELYTAFGHSALRITDPILGFDRIYNFGTFDFATPNFYLKFIQGDLDYFLTAAIAPEVLEEYRDSQQLVVEQKLNLSPAELDELLLAMEANLQPENAAYRYDFVRDNCTTRIRDAIACIAKVQWQPLAKNSPTLRDMVQPYVADRPAIQTGINLLFGANMDHPATTEEAMFLPEDMKIAFDHATIHDGGEVRNLVGSTTILQKGPKLPPPIVNYVVWATYLAAFWAGIALWTRKAWPFWLDIPLLCLVGFIGCFIGFVWFGTRHWVLHENWNLLWAWPTHLLIWFFPKKVQRKYWKIYLGFLVVAPIIHASTIQRDRSWLAVAQQMSTFAGVYLLLVFRAISRINFPREQTHVSANNPPR